MIYFEEMPLYIAACKLDRTKVATMKFGKAHSTLRNSLRIARCNFELVYAYTLKFVSTMRNFSELDCLFVSMRL